MATLAMFRAQFDEFRRSTRREDRHAHVRGRGRTRPLRLGPVRHRRRRDDEGRSGAALSFAAHKLVISAGGQNAKMVSDKGGRNGYKRTQYGQEFALLQLGVTSGFRVS